jgi:hypothetical protein
MNDVQHDGTPATATIRQPQGELLVREEGFPVYTGCRLGLIVDGKIGVSRERSERIRQALAYVARG